MFRGPFPIMHVDDVERSVRFYTEGFGFEVGFRFPDEGPLEFAYLRLGETGIGIGGRKPPAVPDWPGDQELGSFQLCMYTDDTDAAAARLRALGVKQLTAPRVMPWGEKLAFFEDPEGNLIHVTAVLDPSTGEGLDS